MDNNYSKSGSTAIKSFKSVLGWTSSPVFIDNKTNIQWRRIKYLTWSRFRRKSWLLSWLRSSLPGRKQAVPPGPVRSWVSKSFNTPKAAHLLDLSTISTKFPWNCRYQFGPPWTSHTNLKRGSRKTFKRFWTTKGGKLLLRDSYSKFNYLNTKSYKNWTLHSIMIYQFWHICIPMFCRLTKNNITWKHHVNNHHLNVSADSYWKMK